ncbi:(acyl-carrier-protein) S-malonyltransferase [Thioalkalivibrio sulfidiphilus HL-EbGr7]|uniref:Malonyl CoA-acyl carrier protein transacylase n=1 Tax=Thioalkalivibrio sulfidiphilus (strain HL-EbGR7) TaxID=396588 RepID=B8GSL3_THISH|nr:ACP S-malonyltransferase [Thioalkalivibrio sulfidiphilus]ACL72917.1 (acyl-carrier-protein) S-malonyltransferase [Thioalkalivibrio sulfidiphilus HL-EbGr7]
MTFACVFPGQGSQSLGMLSALSDAHPQVRETFQEASDVLGFDLWSLVQNGPEEDLNRTENTQPAMLAAGVAVWRVWQAAGGPAPAVMAGHSLGEYTALVCAGAMGFSDAAGLVAERGRLMQGAVAPGQGAMAAILGLDDAQVIEVCARAAEGGVVEAVNFNSPGQVVIAGETAAVDRAVALAAEAGAKRSVKLPVSVPSHCRLMAGAAERLAERLASVAIVSPSIPVIHNVDVSSHSDPAQIRAVLAAQLHRPVRWVESVQKMAADGVTTVLELGPGKVLTGLNKRIDKTLALACVQDPESLAQALGACRT